MVADLTDDELRQLIAEGYSDAEIESLSSGGSAPESSSWTDSIMSAPLPLPFNPTLGDAIDMGQKTGGAFLDSISSLGNAVLHPIDTVTNIYDNLTLPSALDFGGRTSAAVAGGTAGLPYAPMTYGLSVPLGAAVGAFGYDQASQAVGNHPDTPIKDDIARAIGGDFMPGALMMGAAKAPSAISSKLGDVGTNLYDKTRSLYGAVSQNPSDYRLGVPGLIPMNQAVDDVVANGSFNFNAIKGSKTPFTDLYKQAEAAKVAAGKRVGEFIDDAPNQTTLGELDPRKIIPTQELSKTADNLQGAGRLNAGDSVRNSEFTAQAKQALGDVEFERYQGYKARQARGESWADSYVRDFEDKIASHPVSAKGVQSIRQDWDQAGKMEANRAKSITPVVENFRDLGNSARGTLETLVDNPAFPEANRNFGSLATVTDALNDRIGIDSKPKPGMAQSVWRGITAPFRSAQDAVPYATGNPNQLLKQGMGQTFPQRTGDWLTNVATPALSPGQGTLNALGVAPSIQGGGSLTPESNSAFPGAVTAVDNFLVPDAGGQERPSMSKVMTPKPLTPNLIPVSGTPKEGFALPRNLSAIEPQGLANLIPMYVAPQDAQPLLSQWMRVSASGDRNQMAQFLGAFTEKYPDFPFQRGEITGYASEFDIGDGKPRLFSPTDKQRWEQEIDKSPLSVSEKALRVVGLRKDGLIVPMNVKTNNLEDLMQAAQAKGQYGAPEVQASMEDKVRELVRTGMSELQAKQKVAMEMPLPNDPENAALKNLMTNHKFANRETSLFGSRQVRQ